MYIHAQAPESYSLNRIVIQRERREKRKDAPPCRVARATSLEVLRAVQRGVPVTSRRATEGHSVDVVRLALVEVVELGEALEGQIEVARSWRATGAHIDDCKRQREGQQSARKMATRPAEERRSQHEGGALGAEGREERATHCEQRWPCSGRLGGAIGSSALMLGSGRRDLTHEP